MAKLADNINNMVFNDTTTNQGLYQDALFLTSQNSTSFIISDFTRMANLAMDDITSFILGADGTWQWDDTNQTDLPIGVTDIVNGQVDYSYDADYIVITQMELLDQSGNWSKLTPINRQEYDKPLEEVFGSGTPTHYDKVGSSIFLYPTPNYDLTGGLKAYFQRKGEYFTTTDTTKEPGIAGHLHRFVSVYAAYNYAMVKGLEQMERLRLLLEEYRSKVVKHYSYREKDTQKGLRPLQENNK